MYRQQNIPFDEKFIAADSQIDVEEENHFEQLRLGMDDVKSQIKDWKDSDNVGEWYKASVLEQYLEEGSYRKLSKKTGIPRKSLSETNKNTIKEIREKIKIKKS